MRRNGNKGAEAVLTGRHVLYWFLGFFGLIIAADVTFVRLAVSSYPGEEVAKSYYQGLNYNEVLAERAAQSEIGWRFELIEWPIRGKAGVLRIRMIDQQGQPVANASVKGEFVRPMTETGRQYLAFTNVEPGIYQATVSPLGRGAWKLRLEAKDSAGSPGRLSAQTRIIVE